MKLTHFFIEHPRFAIVLNVFIVLAGLATMFSLPITQYPNIVPPTIKVTTLYPGASADVIARTVATPLEQAINGVEGMEYISSQSTGNGQLTITVIFKIGSNADNDLLLTQTRVQNTLARLPQEVQLQGVQVKKTIDDLLLAVHAYSPDGSRSPQYLSNYMIHIRDEIARLPGVADFLLFGDRQYAMRIWIDPDKAAAYNISATEILAALRAQNAQISAGVLNQPPVTTKGAYQTQHRSVGPSQHASAVRGRDCENGQPRPHYQNSRHRPCRSGFCGLQLTGVCGQISERPMGSCSNTRRKRCETGTYDLEANGRT